jgi:hypothetical protein
MPCSLEIEVRKGIARETLAIKDKPKSARRIYAKIGEPRVCSSFLRLGFSSTANSLDGELDRGSSFSKDGPSPYIMAFNGSVRMLKYYQSVSVKG